MKKIKNIFIVSIYLFFASAFITKQKETILDFTLKNTDGKMVSLANYKYAKGFIIVFTCNHCPFAKLYPPRLNELNKKYDSLGVPLIAVSSTDTMMYEEDTYPKMIAKATDEQFNFPYLFDEMQSVAKNFNAQKTPHAFIIWKENEKWVVKYNGAIDDNGMEPEKVTEHYVANAVDALLANKKITIPETKSIGCQIAFRKK
ncbi:MAG: thioredoxin family protein [Bacteroidota bacterium]|jgi:peroxiredoxin